ncbi:unnamed protein product, partial [Dibothriocephalus latus]
MASVFDGGERWALTGLQATYSVEISPALTELNPDGQQCQVAHLPPASIVEHFQQEPTTLKHTTNFLVPGSSADISK